MASKRKSTTPCMIPSKIVHTSEELRQDSPLLLRPSRVSGAERNSPLDSRESSKAEAATEAVKDGAGTYTCKPCNFETHDLNLFLDHVYSGHPDFRADPSFFCVSCGASAPKFEGLALHNARIHPSTLSTTLQLRRKERRVVVEQNLPAAAETGKDNEISITKTPIMRMLKGKSELKRIVVSHAAAEESQSEPNSATASRDTERKENTVVAVSHVPTIVNNGTTKVTLSPSIQIVNGSGAIPLLKTPITQVVSVVQNRNLQHSAPITVSSNMSSASSSSKNLPKVMIPLSSIPTYSASMDSSSFLKTSFSKFPYPTKAELCYLTVVTKFPEEQIKIWFTAQRLKQGISWSPEEIEEARRKMFNTIIQTAPAGSHNHTATHHGPAQHTITVLPASLGAAGIPHILQGSLVSQGGVIVTQPVMANGIQVSSAPVALAVTPKPQAAARPMMQARPAAALVADKGLSMMVGAVGSSSSQGSYVISSSKSSSNSNSQASVINLSLSNGNHTNSKASSVNGKHVSNSSVSPSNKSKSSSGGAQVKVAKTTSSSSSSSVKTSKVSTAKSETKAAVEGKNSSDTQKNKDSNTSSSSASSPATDLQDSSARHSPVIKLEEASSPLSKSSSSSPAPPPPGSTSSSQTPFNATLDATFYKGKKSPEQLNTLKDSFLVNQFPDQEEVERLIGLTGLTVREVRKWFSDRRYHFRNQKGTRSASAGPNKPASGTGSSSNTSGNTSNTSRTSGSTSGTPGGGAAGSADSAPIDLSESSRAKTPQHSSDALSPTATLTPTSPTTPSRRLPRVPSPDFTAIRYKEREPHQLRALETSFSLDPDPPGEEVDRLRSQTKMTRREIHSWFSEKRKRAAAERKREEAERALREEEEQREEAELDGEEKQREDGSGEPKVNPIKINLKMLKVTEANGDGADCLSTAATPSSSPGSSSSSTPTPKPPSQSSTPTPNKPSHSPKPSAVRGKKTAEQLHLLKQVYARTQWPSAAQYDQLISSTALPRPEVVRWFGDCRYVQKNGQLKWLEAYQSAMQEEELQKGDTQKLQEHLDKHGRLDESQLEVLCESSGLTEDVVRVWFSSKASSPGTPRPADPVAKETTPGTPDVPAEPPTTGSSPPQPQPGGGTEERMEQSVCDGGGGDGGDSEDKNNNSDGCAEPEEVNTETSGVDTKAESD